jgi:thioredoxin reductase (NADPH)
MKEITANDFRKEVLEGGKVVVDFYSTECPPCEALAPKLTAIEELYKDEIRFIKIFRQQNRELAEQLQVKSSPTLLFFNNGEEVTQRLTGGIRRSEIIEKLNSMLSKEKVKAIEQNIKPVYSYYDVIILGAGPAGLTAGLYLCQARIKAIIIDPLLPGGHVAITHQVSNYPGFIQPLEGYMLSHQMSEQTKSCGSIDFKVAVDISRVDLENKEVEIDGYETIKAKKIIIATGTTPNTTNAEGEKEFSGKGISYCATCDAKLYVDKEVVVIGGGNSAVEEADFITRFASKVTLIHQFDKLTANKQAQSKLLANPKVSILYQHEPRKFSRENGKMITRAENLKTGQMTELTSDGIFIFTGFRPNNSLFAGSLLEYDPWGYIKTDDEMRTNIPNVYAIGDIVSKKFRQITTAVADGTIAAMSISREVG